MGNGSVRRIAALGVAGTTAVAGLGVLPTPAQADGGGHYTTKIPTSVGFGGAVTSVDPEASKIGLRVLKNGGNAVDAAVATAAALGVTEPYSSGLGGGGYFVYYNARTHKVRTIDGRETAPAAMPKDAFIEPGTDPPKAYNFTPELVTSGVSVGVPGTPATWAKALRSWGTYRLARALAPAERLARRGFVVDKTFHQQTLDNQKRFEAYTSTPRLFLPGGTAPRTGSVFKNPALARTYNQLGRRGVSWFYRGPIASEIARNVQSPPKSRTTDLPVMKGYIKRSDLAGYRALFRAPTHSGYRGYGIWGMGGSSSGGTTVGEALNIMERFPMRRLSNAQKLHVYLEASALAFADRAKYLGDPAYVRVPRAPCSPTGTPPRERARSTWVTPWRSRPRPATSTATTRAATPRPPRRRPSRTPRTSRPRT